MKRLRDKTSHNARATAEGYQALTLAIQKQQRGEIAEAARIYRRVLETSPANVDALTFLGVAEHQLGHSEEALEHLDRALELSPQHPHALNNRGNVLKELGRLAEAEGDYRSLLALNPAEPNTESNLGVVLRAQGDLAGAEAMFRAAIAHRQGHAAAWQNLGNTLKAQNRLDEALDAYREALRLAPDAADSYRNLGRALYASARVEEATEIYKRWLEHFPDDPRARHFVASCTGEGVPERASDAYVRAEFDSFASDFDEVLARLEYRAPELVTGEVGRLVGEPRANLQVLDAGCGTGLCGPLLRPWAAGMAGVDLSPAMVDLARKRSVYDALVVEELTAYLAARPASWELIVSADTLVYFGDLTDVSRAAAKALRPAGTLIFTVEAAAPDGAPDGYRINPHGRYSHTRDYLLRVLGEAGFEPPAIADVTLRKEATRWVDGYLIGARLPAAT